MTDKPPLPLITDHEFVPGAIGDFCVERIAFYRGGQFEGAKACGQPRAAHKPLPLITDHEFVPCPDLLGCAWRGVICEDDCHALVNARPCGQPRAAHQPEQEPKSWGLSGHVRIYSTPEGCSCGVSWPCKLHDGPPEEPAERPEPKHSKEWWMEKARKEGDTTVMAGGVEPSPEAKPLSAPTLDLNQLFIHWMNHHDVSGCPAGCPFVYKTPGAILEARDAALTERVRRESEQKIRELEQWKSETQRDLIEMAVALAEAGVQNGGPGITDGIRKLGAQLAEANQRAELAEAVRNEAVLLSQASAERATQATQAERERIAKLVCDACRQGLPLRNYSTTLAGTWLHAHDHGKNKSGDQCTSTWPCRAVELGILSDPSPKEKP